MGNITKCFTPTIFCENLYKKNLIYMWVSRGVRVCGRCGVWVVPFLVFICKMYVYKSVSPNSKSSQNRDIHSLWFICYWMSQHVSLSTASSGLKHDWLYDDDVARSGRCAYMLGLSVKLCYLAEDTLFFSFSFHATTSVSYLLLHPVLPLLLPLLLILYLIVFLFFLSSFIPYFYLYLFYSTHRHTTSLCTPGINVAVRKYI